MKFENHIGLDIGTSTIKLVQVSPTSSGQFSLIAAALVETPKFENQTEWDAARIQAITSLVRDSKATSRQVVVSLSESEVFTRVVELPHMEEAEISQSIRWQAEQYIPVPLTDVVLKHQVLSPVGNDKIRVMLVAAPTTLVNSVVSLLSRAKLETIALETETLAVARVLVGLDPELPNTLLVHIGAESTTLSIFIRGDLALTSPVNTGGNALTRAIATSLGLDVLQAEEYKKTYGLDATKLDGKVKAACQPIVAQIIAEVKRAMAFHESRNPNAPVRRLVLSGGSALTPELITHFTENLSMEVELGNPFARVALSETAKRDLLDSGPLYSVAVGLAMKET